ncbi:uncharacterized protein [Nicotiana tomentosiformis]|uniref:uncharacterized protein n=1 Tax=Nicotiana tomentosiformis TaxID=4098 RepID=UPI00388C9B44
MVDTKAVPWNYKQVIVTYKGKEVEEEVNETGGLTRSGRYDELPMEGTEHNRALYLIVKCEDSAVSRVLVDNGSSANICPLSTLQKLKIDTERIHMNNEIVVHGDENLSTYNDIIVPFIEVEDDKGPWVYQTFETVSVEKIPQGECIPGPKLPSVSVMVANEILKNGFVPGKGLGSSLQGIAHPVCPRESFGTFGLGFTLIGKDMKKAKNLKRKAWSLPKHVPHISKSFVKPGVAKRPISAVPKPVVDFDKELIKRFQSLFYEVNMVEIGEGSSNADVQLVGPNVKLSNWKATLLPTRKEFCSFYAGFNDMTCIRNFQPNLKSQSNSETTFQEVECDDETEYDEEAAFQEISRELNHFEEKPKPNLNETEAINLGDQDNIRETKISVHLEPQIKEEIIKALFEYKDVFAWSYDDMPGLSTDLVVHKLPTDPPFPPVKQKLRKFKTDMSVKIKEEITKQLDAKVIRVTRYPTWLSNVVPVPKKDVSRRGIELDPSKIKAIQELPPPKNKTEVMSLLERVNYISRFIAQLTTTCEPIFKLLKKNAAVKWTDECQEAFDQIKSYLSNPPVLVPPKPGRPLILYLTLLDNSFGCVLG